MALKLSSLESFRALNTLMTRANWVSLALSLVSQAGFYQVVRLVSETLFKYIGILVSLADFYKIGRRVSEAVF